MKFSLGLRVFKRPRTNQYTNKLWRGIFYFLSPTASHKEAPFYHQSPDPIPMKSLWAPTISLSVELVYRVKELVYILYKIFLHMVTREIKPAILLPLPSLLNDIACDASSTLPTSLLVCPSQRPRFA